MSLRTAGEAIPAFAACLTAVRAGRSEIATSPNPLLLFLSLRERRQVRAILGFSR